MIKLDDTRLRDYNAIRLKWNIVEKDPNQIKLPLKRIAKTSRNKIKKFKDKIATVGFHSPVLIDGENEAITGCARILAARELGLKTIPTLCHSELSPEHLRAIRVADNFGLGGLDFDEELLGEELKELEKFGFNLLDLGFDAAELDKIFAAATAGLDQSEDLAPPQMPVPKTSDAWRLGDHRLICDDCRDPDVLLKLLGGVSVAAVITDPPFNVPIAGHVSGLGKNKHREFAMASGEMSDEQFEQFNVDYLKAAGPFLKAGGYVYVFMDWRGTFTVTKAAQQLPLHHINTCVWVKTNGGMGSLYRSQHEFALVFRKDGGKAVNNVQLGRYGRNRTNVWNCAGANAFGATRDADLADHPTVKPIQLIEDIIKDSTNRGDVVLDLFGGSGTTLLAAERCRRVAVLCEIDPGYVDVTIRRFEQMTGVEAIHEETGLTYAALKQQRQQPSA